MCTDTDHGFASSNERSNTITWKSVRNGVRKVELVFKQTGDQGHAQIAEMEIIYNNERNDIGKCDGKFEVSTHTDCPGNNINLIVLAGSDHTVCASKCQEDGDCLGYTWHGRSSNWSECWIKNAVTNCEAIDAGQCYNGTCISGVLSQTCTAHIAEPESDYKIETNYDCTGGDISHNQIWGSTDARCKEMCDKDSKCVGYVWSGKESTQSWCHLKHAMVNCKQVSAGECGGSLKRTCYTGWKQNIDVEIEEGNEVEDGKAIRHNEIIHSDIIVYETFDISIMLNLEKNTFEYPNIFGFQKEGTKAYDNGYPIGSRVPAVWLRPNSNALHVCMSLNGDGNSCWNSPEMPVDTWFKLNIRQIFDQDDQQYSFQILINDELKRSVTNRQAMTFEAVNGILGNSYQERDYPTAVGQFKDFNFKSSILSRAGFEIVSDVITPGLSCSAGNGNGRIVGGDHAKKGSWPWLVQLEVDCSDDGGTYVCGGTILSNTRILTAAHCFCGAIANKTRLDTVRVSVGNWNQYDEEEEGEFVVIAEKINIHPQFGSIKAKGETQLAYDFAILNIPDLSKVKRDSCIKCYDSACLPTKHADHGRSCWIGGWGATKKRSAQQKEVGVHIMGDEYCRQYSQYEAHSYLHVTYDVEFCAGRPDINGDGFTDEGADSCQGDSGGPLICDDDGKPIVYGITSWGEGCASTGYPGIYAKVAAELDWIKQQL